MLEISETWLQNYVNEVSELFFYSLNIVADYYGFSTTKNFKKGTTVTLCQTTKGGWRSRCCRHEQSMTSKNSKKGTTVTSCQTTKGGRRKFHLTLNNNANN